MNRFGLVCASILVVILTLGLPAMSRSAPPAGFVTDAIPRPDSAPWDEVVGMQFSTDGRLYAWERKGRVWIIDDNNPTVVPFLDISDEVGAWRDFGLLGFTLHPNFKNLGYVYLLYVVDRYHLLRCQEDPSGVGQPICDAGYDPLADDYFSATIGRIARYTAIKPEGDSDFSNAVAIDYNSRKVLLGESKDTGIPILYESHGTGSILFGHDGTLIAASGDGASYSAVDTGSASETYYQTALSDGIISAKENVGAYRAQLVDSLSGKLLRIDPMTGDGVASNPFYDSDNPRSARSRVWALGLRNPFRVTMRPGSGEHTAAAGRPGVFYIGDVGWTKWEDLNIARIGGQNFGWPAFEGMKTHSSYWNRYIENLDAPNPLFGTGGCTQEYFYFRDLIQQDTLAAPLSFPNPCDAGQQIPTMIDLFAHTRPEIDWRHGSGPARWSTFNGDVAENPEVGQWNTEGTRIVLGTPFAGNSSTGGVWYTGSDFPSEYHNTYFHGDFGGQWIRNFVVDPLTDTVLEVKEFDSAAGGVVAMETHPSEGGLYYISWASQLMKVSYAPGGNQAPQAVAAVDQAFSATSSLAAQFTGDGSSDPEGLPLAYEWDFGDGSAASSEANPQHTFSAAPGVPTRYDVTLVVTDSAGLTSQASVVISINNTPPAVTITSPMDGSEYPAGGDLFYDLTADIADAEHSGTDLGCDWQRTLHHNEHTHTEAVGTDCSTTTVISGLGCGSEVYFWSFELSVTDAAGLSTTDTSTIYPNCGPDLPPVANDDTAVVQMGGAVDIDVLANDTDDFALDPTTVQIVDAPALGDAVVDPVSGLVTYADSTGAPGNDSFTYTVSDNGGSLSNVATVNVSISGLDMTAPTVPQDLAATPLSYAEIRLTWSASTDTGGSGLAGYHVYRDGDATPVATIAGTSHIDGGLTGNTAYTYQVSAIDGADNESALSDPTAATTPPEPVSGLVSGVVRDAITLLPIEGALVTLQATTTQASTNAAGEFALDIPDGGSNLVIVGANKGHYNKSITTDSPAAGAEILLQPVTIGTNASYEFVEPELCAGCHPNQKSEWDNSAMARTGTNAWVHDVYNGDGTPGGMGGFVYTRDSVHAANVPDADCASCHQPESWIAAGYSGRLEGPGDVGYPSDAASHGISCETCHKIADVDTQKMNFPGIFPAAVQFNLPEVGTQVQYGVLPDVGYHVAGTMEASYQPQMEAEICSTCHQDNADPNEDHTFTGITSEPTFDEWRQSSYGNDPNSPMYTTCTDCHMPPSGHDTISVAVTLTRDPDTVRTHAIEGTTPAYLENAVELSMQTQVVDNALQVEVTIDNSLTGHHVPTGVPVRNMVLLVEAWEDGQDPLVNPLVHTGTQTVHALGGIGDPAQGYYAGLPGKLYAKVDQADSGQSPTFFTDATSVVFDNRIPALALDQTSYTFAVPVGSGTIRVRARLIYRRAFRALVDAKGWTEDGHGNPLADIAGPHYGHLMGSATIDLPFDTDADSDGVADSADNCTLVANPDQRDTNDDGYGNACDADLDNDGVINFADLALFKSVFLSNSEDADFNGDGYVNFGDLALVKGSFLGAPGPSGRAP